MKISCRLGLCALCLLLILAANFTACTRSEPGRTTPLTTRAAQVPSDPQLKPDPKPEAEIKGNRISMPISRSSRNSATMTVVLERDENQQLLVDVEVQAQSLYGGLQVDDVLSFWLCGDQVNVEAWQFTPFPSGIATVRHWSVRHIGQGVEKAAVEERALLISESLEPLRYRARLAITMPELRASPAESETLRCAVGYWGAASVDERVRVATFPKDAEVQHAKSFHPFGLAEIPVSATPDLNTARQQARREDAAIAQYLAQHDALTPQRQKALALTNEEARADALAWVDEREGEALLALMQAAPALSYPWLRAPLLLPSERFPLAIAAQTIRRWPGLEPTSRAFRERLLASRLHDVYAELVFEQACALYRTQSDGPDRANEIVSDAFTTLAVTRHRPQIAERLCAKLLAASEKKAEAVSIPSGLRSQVVAWRLMSAALDPGQTVEQVKRIAREHAETKVARQVVSGLSLLAKEDKIELYAALFLRAKAACKGFDEEDAALGFGLFCALHLIFEAGDLDQGALVVAGMEKLVSAAKPEQRTALVMFQGIVEVLRADTDVTQKLRTALAHIEKESLPATEDFFARCAQYLEKHGEQLSAPRRQTLFHALAGEMTTRGHDVSRLRLASLRAHRAALEFDRAWQRAQEITRDLGQSSTSQASGLEPKLRAEMDAAITEARLLAMVFLETAAVGDTSELAALLKGMTQSARDEAMQRLLLWGDHGDTGMLMRCLDAGRSELAHAAHKRLVAALGSIGDPVNALRVRLQYAKRQIALGDVRAAVAELDQVEASAATLSDAQRVRFTEGSGLAMQRGLAAMRLQDYARAASIFSALLERETSPANRKTYEEAQRVAREFAKVWPDERDRYASEKADLPLVRIVTERGEIELVLFEDEAPETVANFLRHVESGAYNHSTIHRLVPGFVAQGGRPQSGNSERTIHLEAQRRHFRGCVGMARREDIDSADSQFYFVLADSTATLKLDGKYAVFGRVVKGLEVMDALRLDSRILDVSVLRKRDHAYHFSTVQDEGR